MTEQDRARVRGLQDRLISAAERLGIGDKARVSMTMPEEITVGVLRRYIYPQWETALESILYRLEGER